MFIDCKLEDYMFWCFIGHQQVFSLGYIGENLKMANKVLKHEVF